MAENNPFPGENNTGHFWDDNLRELRNPAPRWWMIGFWASILWWIGYGILFPMWPTLHGNTEGILGWSQIKEYDEGVAQVQSLRSEYEEKLAGMTPKEIMSDPGLNQYTLASAKVLFGDNCSACHGSGGQGNPGFPVLADDDWLYGGTTAKIGETITGGRKPSMPAHAKILSKSDIDTLAHWVVQMSDTGGKGGSEEGWNLFRTKGCIACHGAKANGHVTDLPNGQFVTVGAANLTDGIFRFRPSGVSEDQPLTDEQKLASATHTITYGVNQPGVPETRNAEMPAFGQTGKLDQQQIKKLVVYVYQLGGGQ
jgi:cytochrome c oxidase cbb3-type subunit III